MPPAGSTYSALSNARAASTDADMFADIAALWGDAAYVDFQKQLRRKNRLVLFALGVFARAIRTAPTRMLAMMAAIMLHPHLQHFDARADVLFYGPTKNNRKVLSKLGTLLQDPVTQHYATAKAPLTQRFAAAMGWSRLWQLSQALAPYRNSTTLLALQLLLTGTARAYFETALATTKARMVVVANDHSPMQVGLCRAAKAGGLSCVYRQHAPISPLYPALKFDLAVLSNAASLAAYQKRGAMTGDIVFLSAFQTGPAPIRKPAKIATVGKCLSRVWAPEAVTRRLRELCAHPEVTRIILRRHPQDTSDLTALCHDPRIILADPDTDAQSFARACDLVVVPGSGIAVELLHAGTPTVYAGDLDRLGHDPHGFVASGLLRDMTDVPLTTLSASVGDFFDADWAQAFAAFDATATMSPAQMEQATRDALSRLLDKDGTGVDTITQPALPQRPL